MNNDKGAWVKVQPGERHKKNGLHQRKAGGWAAQRDFHVCYLAGDEAANRAQTSKRVRLQRRLIHLLLLSAVSRVLDLLEK